LELRYNYLQMTPFCQLQMTIEILH
jgi:hypothetical protein